MAAGPRSPQLAPHNVHHQPVTNTATRNTHPNPARARSGLGGKVAPARVACTSMRLPLAPGCGAEQSSHGNSPAAPDIRQSVQRTRGCPARRGCREKCCPARVRRLRSGHLGVSRPSAARPLCSSRWRVVGECFGDVALAPIGCARCLGARSVSPSMNEGSLSSPPLCFGGTGRLREVVARRHGCWRSPDRTGGAGEA